ncbi:unnamed protein product [Rangifer tarandus platyrhynchus]|uniref:Uncharacterized protein n=1 Tax=Rangifer tarandus platyrhynchus TaxID=3082113 RepID=A0AC59YB56_RANTA
MPTSGPAPGHPSRSPPPRTPINHPGRGGSIAHAAHDKRGPRIPQAPWSPRAGVKDGTVAQAVGSAALLTCDAPATVWPSVGLRITVILQTVTEDPSQGSTLTLLIRPEDSEHRVPVLLLTCPSHSLPSGPVTV